MKRRFTEELQKIHDEFPDYGRSGLVEYQVWLKIIREQNPEVEKLFVKTQP